MKGKPRVGFLVPAIGVVVMAAVIAVFSLAWSECGKITLESANEAWVMVLVRDIPDEGFAELLLDRSEDGFAVRRRAEDPGILFHHRRRLDDGDLLFLVNTSIESASSGVIVSHARGAEQRPVVLGKVDEKAEGPKQLCRAHAGAPGDLGAALLRRLLQLGEVLAHDLVHQAGGLDLLDVHFFLRHEVLLQKG